MKIVLDCFGGDNCPQAPIDGALNALNRDDKIEVMLCGSQSVIENYLKGKKYDTSRLSILGAEDVITNEDLPSLAIRRKPNSSMVMSLRAVADGKADAVISCGSTGALLTGATLIIKRIEGITRASLACIVPTIISGKSAAIVDGGANVDCTLPMLKEFAIMGDAFAKSMFGIEKPIICLMNNGVEEEKGNVLAKEAYQMLKTVKVNFKGNVEPREILFGNADAVVCDGFVGNAAIKGAEGMASAIFKVLGETIKNGGLKTKIGALLLKPALRAVKARLNSDTIGGAPFLGVNNVVVKAHGSSNKVAFENAIFTAKRMVEDKLVENIRIGLAENV